MWNVLWFSKRKTVLNMNWMWRARCIDMDREYTSCLRNVHIYGKTIEKDRKLDINSHMIVSVINKGKLRKFREEIPSQKNLKKKQPRLNSSIRNKCAVSIWPGLPWWDILNFNELLQVIVIEMKETCDKRDQLVQSDLWNKYHLNWLGWMTQMTQL